jgi:hypothetical protein
MKLSVAILPDKESEKTVEPLAPVIDNGVIEIKLNNDLMNK